MSIINFGNATSDPGTSCVDNQESAIKQWSF